MSEQRFTAPIDGWYRFGTAPAGLPEGTVTVMPEGAWEPWAVTIVKAVQTCWACPSQWDAWTDTGQYLYLRYRSGRGTVDRYPDNDSKQWTRVPDGEFTAWRDEDRLAGEITLPEFCEKAGIAIAPDAELR